MSVAMTPKNVASARRVESKNSVRELRSFFARREDENPMVRKEVTDFRDRAAYVYITGSFPTHLRSFFTSLLRKATKYTAEPTAIDGRSGSVAMNMVVIRELDLQNHPMVKKVREYVSHGYNIQQSRGFAERRPYSRVFLFKEIRPGVAHKVSIKTDGSVKDGWQ
jgi:hypothetical protein